jgi:hypothetical protein
VSIKADYVHNPTIAGFSIFIPNFTVVGGFADRYLLYILCVSFVYRSKYPTSARVFFGGVVGCPVGQICPKIRHFCAKE